MGSCLSSRVKDEIGSKDSKLQSSGRERNGFSGGSNKVSSVSAPQSPRSEGDILLSSNLKSFAFSDLRTATRNFRPDSVIGEGGFGSVFKGWVDEETLAPARSGTGMLIAVKRLNQEGSQGHNEWLRLLLDTTGSAYYQTLSWKLRIKIALGAAKGLEFLHSDEVRVIYRDFKTSNILLDSNYDAKLSDFGLARDGPSGDKSHVSTRIMGTFGYAAPEYMATGHLTEKSDVYSFGVVLLEMLCGRKAMDKNRPSGEHNLVEWARSHLTSKRKILHIFDSRLQGQYTPRGALRAVRLAFRCLSTESKLRPDMKEVVKSLEQLQELEDAVASEDSGPQEMDHQTRHE
ncbi:hypothetical protein SAY86_025297 [Trapa natans]|uniref:Protein kinase domain-containing protein n=1 Tax=Trapa natans TaxID=22666 RepID=A0AAN7M825_TRANT|nr:hypothetical protein SAY86_025297 [Trapa natans]